MKSKSILISEKKILENIIPLMIYLNGNMNLNIKYLVFQE